MRVGWVGLALCASCTSAPRTVEIAAPLATSAATALPADDEPLPKDAARAPSSTDGSWAASFPASKSFVSIELPRAAHVVLHWRVGASHKVKELPPEEDYGGNYVTPVAIVVRAKGVEKTIALGELAGSADPGHESYCAHAGFTSRSEPDLAKPEDPSAAAWFATGTMQGDSRFMIVRDADAMYVLHTETSDGYCEATKQGPLDICEGFKWERVAEIHGVRGAALYELLTEEGKTIDCGADRMGERLTRP